MSSSLDKVTEHSPNDASLVSSLYDAPDYQDRYSVNIQEGQYKTVDEVVTDWFVKQPTWLRIVSTNTFSKDKIVQAANVESYEVGHKIGSWEVVDRDQNEIVFSDHMGFMHWGFSFYFDNNHPNKVEGATSVEYLWQRVAGFYFGLIKPFHRRFVKKALVIATR